MIKIDKAMIDLVLQNVLGSVTKDFRGKVEKALQDLHTQALKTKNPWDDVFTTLMCKAFGIEPKDK